jgi:peptidylprolyl isomerase
MKQFVLVCILTLGLISNASSQTLVTFYTNQGNFVVELDDSIMPITAGNFKSLVTSKFYDGVIFHRIISGFVIQGGDPTGTGSGGPGYTIQDEFVAGQTNVKQTLSMANSGQPNSGGSQFFINLTNNTFLDFNRAPLTSKHPVFAEVVSGWPIVETIEMVAVNSSDRPINDVVMDSLRVTGSSLSAEELALNVTRTAIYPNPITVESVLDLYLEEKQQISIEILDQSGRIVLKTSENCSSGKNLLSLGDLGLRSLSTGSYFLSIKGQKIRKKMKFVVTN